jgi:hypothetical protein
VVGEGGSSCKRISAALLTPDGLLYERNYKCRYAGAATFHRSPHWSHARALALTS